MNEIIVLSASRTQAEFTFIHFDNCEYKIVTNEKFLNIIAEAAMIFYWEVFFIDMASFGKKLFQHRFSAVYPHIFGQGRDGQKTCKPYKILQVLSTDKK